MSKVPKVRLHFDLESDLKTIRNASVTQRRLGDNPEVRSSHTVQNYLSMLKNIYRSGLGCVDMHDLGWLLAEWPRIREFCLAKPNVKTRKKFLMAVSAALWLLDPSSVHVVAIRTEIKHMTRDLCAAIAEHDAGLDEFEKRSWVPLSEFERARDELEPLALPLIKPSNTRALLPEQIELVLQFLVLAWNTYRPPNRTEMCELVVLRRLPADPHSSDVNFIVAAESEPMVVAINRDKVVHHLGRDLLPVENHYLIQLVLWSLRALPRRYLFCDPADCSLPMPLEVYNHLLGRAWAPERSVDYRIVRSAYVTAFYKRVESMAERERLAQKMRH